MRQVLTASLLMLLVSTASAGVFKVPRTYVEPSADPTTAALDCTAEMRDGKDAFADCWIKKVARGKQRHILDCLGHAETNAGLAICARADTVDARQIRFADCMVKYARNRRADRERAATELITCAGLDEGPDYRISPEQKMIFNCIIDNPDSYSAIGACAVRKHLTPEQRAFLDCAISTSGDGAYSFAGCVGTRLTQTEIDKCFTIGIGGRGCFGDNNTAVILARNAWRDVTQGPGPNNDLLGRDGFAGRTLENGRHDIQHGPGETNDLTGRKGWVRQRLGF